MMPRILLLLASIAAALIADSTLAQDSLPAQEYLPLGGGSAEAPASQSNAFMPGGLEFIQVGGALLGVVALLFGLRAVLRRMGGVPNGRRPEGVIQVHARYPIARGQHVVLLQVGQRIIVAHQGSGGMRTLSEITNPEEVARLRGTLQAAGGRGSRVDHRLDADFQSELRAATAASPVVDLTRSARPESRPETRSSMPRRRTPWRGAS